MVTTAGAVLQDESILVYTDLPSSAKTLRGVVVLWCCGRATEREARDMQPSTPCMARSQPNSRSISHPKSRTCIRNPFIFCMHDTIFFSRVATKSTRSPAMADLLPRPLNYIKKAPPPYRSQSKLSRFPNFPLSTLSHPHTLLISTHCSIAHTLNLHTLSAFTYTLLSHTLHHHTHSIIIITQSFPPHTLSALTDVLPSKHQTVYRPATQVFILRHVCQQLHAAPGLSSMVRSRRKDRRESQ